MALRTTVTERQRRLGAELRRLRERTGLSASEAGKFIGMGRAHLSHVEGGRTAIPTDSLRALCRSYGCTSEPYIDALVALSESTGKGWWTQYRHTLPQYALDLAELESAADSIRWYESLFIPGLFQTEDYTRAIFESSPWPKNAQAREAAVAFRMERQHILTGPNAPQIHAVIHEAALHIRFGGAAVMHRQLRHLIELADLPNLTLRVLPFTAKGISSLSTPFTITGSHGNELTTALVEHPSESQFMHGPESLDQYSDHFNRLSKAALPPVDARALPVEHDSSRDSLGIIQHILYTL